MFKKILVAIDLTESEMTEQSIDKAAALARAFIRELRLVNAQTLAASSATFSASDIIF